MKKKMKTNNFIIPFIHCSVDDLYYKLKINSLSSKERDKAIERICKEGPSQLKRDILNFVSNLSVEDMSKIALSLDENDDIDTIILCLKTCSGVISESTENYLVGIYINAFHKHHIVLDEDTNLHPSSIKMIAENFLKLYDENALIWCFKQNKFLEFRHLFFERILEIGSHRTICMLLYNYDFILDETMIKNILAELYNLNAKFELSRTIEENTVSSKYFVYIMNLLNSIDNLNLEDIQNIPASNLDSDGRHILTNLYLKLGTCESILNYFEVYNNCLDEMDIRLILKKLCELHDKNSLIALSRYEIVKPYYDDIFGSLSQIENISYDDICEIDFGILSKDNKDEYVNIVCRNPYTPYLCGFACLNKLYLEKNHIDKIVSILCDRLDAKCIYKFAKEIDKLSKDNISDLAKALSETNSSKYIYKFAKKVKNISKDDISILANAIYKTDDIEYIYLFLKNVSNIKKEDKRLLKSKIFRSYNMKFIYLTALYIDTNLIKKLFHDENTMYACMIETGLFSNNELVEAYKKLFSKKIDVSLVELSAQIKAEEISCKKKKMTIKEELNKKDNKKGNK